MFDGRVLDMMELGIEDIKAMEEFESVKASIGVRPLIVFHSDLFDTTQEYQLLKSFFLDFYNGHALPELPLTTGIEHVISITAGPASDDVPRPKVHFRVYTIKMLATSGSRARGLS